MGTLASTAAVMDKGYEYEYGQLTDTTGASYTTDGTKDVTWTCNKLGKKTIIVKNNDEAAVHTIYYRIRGRVYPAGQLVNIKAETSIAVSTTVKEVINDFYYQIVIDVKNNSGAAAFVIEYGGRFLA